MNIGPRVAGTAVAGGSAHAVTDGVTTIEIPLHHGIVARRLAWIDPADGVLRGAERVAMAWSPASDLAVPPASASVSHGDQDGDVTVDAAAPATGGTKELARQPCLTGVCTASVRGYLALPATVEPGAP